MINKEYVKIPGFLKSLNTIVDSNLFDKSIEDYAKKNQKVNVIICKKQTKIDLVHYLYAVYIFPTISIFIKAISSNNFIIWPGLNSKLILKHLPKSILTYQGHMHLEK